MPFRSPLSHRAVAAVVLAVALPSGALAGCGSSAKDVSKKDSAVVGTQAGLAAGTARAKVLAPSIEAAMKKGSLTRTQSIADAATASEYVVRALAQAQIAAAKDPKLKPLASKLQAAGASIGALTVTLRSGKTPPKSLLTGCLGTVESVENALHDAGIPFKDQVASNLS